MNEDRHVERHGRLPELGERGVVELDARSGGRRDLHADRPQILDRRAQLAHREGRKVEGHGHHGHESIGRLPAEVGYGRFTSPM